jgi:hypothetical protein
MTRKQELQMKSFFARHFPHIKLPTIWRTHAKLEKHTGIRPVWYDCCVNSCQAFTGICKDATHCTQPKDPSKSLTNLCNEPRYFEKLDKQGKLRPRKRYMTIPLEPRLRQQWMDEQQAEYMMEYRQSFNNKRTDDYRDVFDGKLYQKFLRETKGLFQR